jgi:periplasmic divalent cation tolerance protein
MKTTAPFRVVLVTAPNIKVARQLVKLALTQRAAACANLIPKIESHYWWKGKLEKTAEMLILFKTRASKLVKLEKLILENHPYDNPEIISLNITAGNNRYLNWLANETRDQESALRKKPPKISGKTG